MWTAGRVHAIVGARYATQREAHVHLTRLEQPMRRQVTAALGTVVAVGLAVTPSLAPAAARTTGRESFRGTLVKTAPSGTSVVVSTVIGTSGVFKGLGRIAELARRPGDPQNV